MATVRILTLPTLEPEEAAAGHFVATDNAKDGNRKVDIGSFIHSVNEAIDDIEAGTALADGAVITEKIADGAITNDKVATDAIETDNILDAAVTNAKLADNAVQTENLVTGAVTTDKLGADAVTNAKLADNAVQTENLVNESVTNAKLASDSVKTGNIVDENVTTSKLASGAVTTAKLDVDAVTNAKLADNAVQTENIVDANVTADKIANAAVTNDKLASNAVDSANIKSSAVITAKIADGAVTHDKVATNAIEAANIKDGEVGTSKLASGAVTNAKLASNAVETGNIKDAAVTTDKIANAAVTNSKLATDSVQTGNIKDGNVTNAKLASDAVGTSNIQNGSVTLAKIATGSEATQSASGLMSVTDKTKLDGFSQASDYALKTDISSAINYRGSVATESDLPSTGQKVGDMYNIVAASSYGAAGTNVAWTGSAWDSLGEKFTIGDGTLTPIMVASGYNFMTDAEQTKLSGIETGANKTIVDSALDGSSTNPVQNSVVKEALDAKAPLASPALTGTPTAPTATSGTNTTQVATTAFVKSAVDAKFPVVNADVATDAVDTTNIKNGAVTTDKLGANAVTHAKLASNSVEANNIKDGEVGTSKLASGAVTNDKLASNAVETANIKDANVTNAKLATNAVETGNIKNLNVTTDKLADSAVTEAKIANGAITKAKFSSELSTELDNKADIDGDYSTLTVGKADNLTGRYDAVEADYLYRTAGGNQDIDTGTARIESIRGKTLVWNQLCTLHGGTSTERGVTIVKSNTTGTITLSGTSDGIGGIAGIPVKNVYGHKYLIRGNCSDLSKAYLSSQSYGSDIDGRGVIITNSSNAAVWYYVIYIPDTGIEYDNVTLKPMVIDLTLMFGAGNEPSTVEEFEALFPEPYYPYDEGSLLSVNMEGVRTVGFNQWDEEWEVGSFNTDTGDEDFSNDRIRSKNYIPCLADTQYTFTVVGQSSMGFHVLFYDADKNYLGFKDSASLFDTPSKARYIRFRMYVSYGTTYNHDICINLHWTGYRDGEYESYAKYERDIPVSTYFPDGMKSAGSVYDELTEDKAIKRVGVVDLGTLTWSAEAAWQQSKGLTRLFATVSGAATTNSENVTASGYFEPNLTVIGSTMSAAYCIAMMNGKVYVTMPYPDITTMADFATWLTSHPVTIDYALAEPIVTPIDSPIPLTYEVDDFGTEEVMVDETQPAPQSAPPSMQVIYGPNVIDTVRRLPKEYISHDSMTQFRNALPFETTEKWDPVHNRYKYTAFDFMSRLNGVMDYIRYGVHQLESETWPYVAGLADLGEDALDLIPIGTELTDNWHDTHAATAVDYDFPWLVQSLEKFIFENQIEPMYGIVLGAKYTLPFGTQFDEKEAFYAVGPEGLVAGTYYFTWGFTWGSASVVTGNTYTLTTTNDYSEGAQFVFANQPQSSEIDGTNVNVYATCGGTTIAETCVLTKNNIEGATSLGTITTNQIVEGQLLNHGHRCCYGNGNWAESAIRQYLNTWADGGTWWTPQNKWDRPPSYANYDGFMKGLPPELRAVIQKTKVVTALSYSADAGTAAAPETVVTYDYFFLPSWEQHWLKVDSSYGAQEGLEGTPFPYWKKVSGVTTPWAAGTTHPEYIHYDLANHNTARDVFLRSARRYYGYYVACIGSSGYCTTNDALYGNFVVPVCVIRKAIA